MSNAFIRTAQAGNEPQAVECGTCVRCCKNQVVPIIPERGDNPDALEHKSKVTDPRTGEDFWVLKWDDRGFCMYLDQAAGACTIRDTAPAMCRNFSCVTLFLASQAIGRNERRDKIKRGHYDRAVLNEGKKRALPDHAARNSQE